MQIFASKKVFVIVYAIAGMQQFAMASYSIGTMSTIEKNYKMSSQQSGKVNLLHKSIRYLCFYQGLLLFEKDFFVRDFVVRNHMVKIQAL